MFKQKPCGLEKPGSPFKYGKWKTYKKTLELVQVPRLKAIAESLNCQQIKLPRMPMVCNLVKQTTALLILPSLKLTVRP